MLQALRPVGTQGRQKHDFRVFGGLDAAARKSQAPVQHKQQIGVEIQDKGLMFPAALLLSGALALQPLPAAALVGSSFNKQDGADSIPAASSLSKHCMFELAAADEKATNLPIDEMRDRIIKTFKEDQYYITGKLDRSIFDNNCVFTDPTITLQVLLTLPRFFFMIFSFDVSLPLLSALCCGCGIL